MHYHSTIIKNDNTSRWLSEENPSVALENFDILDEIEKFRCVLTDKKIQTETATFVQEAFLFRKNTKL